jgi:hypothetical protein
MNRNRSVSSSPDPLGGTPRTTTQSTNPDLARSPTPQNSDDDPNSPQEENGTSNNSSIPSTRTDSIPVAREISLGAETEDGEDSRESPSFEGVKFSSSLDHNLNSADSPQRLATSRIHSPDDNPSPGRARGLEKDRPEVHDQPTRTRTKAPTAASSLHRPGSSSSRNIQSSQMPSTTLASKTTHLLSRNKTTSVMRWEGDAAASSTSVIPGHAAPSRTASEISVGTGRRSTGYSDRRTASRTSSTRTYS